MLYIFIIAILFMLIYHFDYQNHTKGREESYAVICFILICIAGLRYRIGVDSIRYETSFGTLPSIFEIKGNDFSDSKYDPAYLLLAVLAKTFSSDFMVLQFFQAVFVNVILFKFFKKFTDHIFLAVTIYFIFLYINFMCEVMREACAVCCLLLAYPYFEKHQWGRYYLYAILCVLFHTSGLIAIILPVFTLPIIRSAFVLGKRTIIIALGILLLGEFIRIRFFEYIEALTFMEKMQDKVATYEDSELAENVLNIYGILASVFKNILYPALALIVISKKKQHKGSNALEFMIVVGMYMAIISIPIALFYRFNNYFFPFMIIAISNVSFNSMKFQHHTYRLTFFSWLIIMLPWFGLRIYGYYTPVDNTGLREVSRYYPYASRLFPTKDPKREQIFNYYGAQ